MTKDSVIVSVDDSFVTSFYVREMSVDEPKTRPEFNRQFNIDRGLPDTPETPTTSTTTTVRPMPLFINVFSSNSFQPQHAFGRHPIRPWIVPNITEFVETIRIDSLSEPIGTDQLVKRQKDKPIEMKTNREFIVL